MFKKIQAILLAFCLSIGILMAGNGVFAYDVQKSVLKLNKTYAQNDAKLHRHDFISRSKNSAKIENNDEEKSTQDTEQAKKPTVVEPAKNNLPNRIVVSFNGDPSTQRAFNWYTSEQFDSYVLISTNADLSAASKFEAEASEVESHYVERDSNGYFIYQLTDLESGEAKRYFTDEGRDPKTWSAHNEISDPESEQVEIAVTKVSEYSYKAIATDLEPDTTYYYRVGSDQGYLSPLGSFKTASAEAKDFSFIFYTDTQNAYWNQNLIDEAAYCANTLAEALKLEPEVDFTIHGGDIVEIAEVEDEWVDLFGQSMASFLQTTIAPVPGNHDEYGLSYDERFITKYNEHFNVPAANDAIDGGSYYSYDYNGVHFVHLNTNDYKNADEKSLGDEQQAWLKADVKAARENGAKFVIAVFHKPLFSKSYHSLQDSDVQNVRDEFMQLLDELDIDVAMQGHDHVLSRTYALGYNADSKFKAKVIDKGETKDQVNILKKPEGTIFTLPNTGGTKAYDAIYDKSLEHIKKVRPKLDWLTEELLAEYNSFFAMGYQPHDSERFSEKHSNFRDSKLQNFSIYRVQGNSLIIETYQISGDLGKRQVELIDTCIIEK